MKKCPFCKTIPNVIYVPDDNCIIYMCKCARVLVDVYELWDEIVTDKAKEVLAHGNYLLHGDGKGEI